jgi:hypothetical protein
MFKLFSTRLSKVQFAAFLAASSTAFILSACAGGVGEETNTIADASSPDNPSDTPQVSELPDLDKIISDSSSIPAPDLELDSQKVVIDPWDSQPTPSTTVPLGVDFRGVLYNTDGEILSVALELPTETRETTTDSTGFFTLENVPDGTYPLIVSSENTDVAYLLQNEKSSQMLLGPVSSAKISSITASDLKAPSVKNIFYNDEMPSVGNPEIDPSEPDSSSKSDSSKQGGYGDGSSVAYLTVDGGAVIKVATNNLPKDLYYGLVKRWNNEIANASTENDIVGIFYSLTEWTIEVKFELSSIDMAGVYRRNIFGQFDEENSLFSLALIKGECGTSSPALAFYVGNSNKFSCKSSVISGVLVDAGQTISVTVTYDGSMISLYKNGFLVAYSFVDYKFIPESSLPPFVFGDSDLDLKLDEVRLGNKTINSADVLYRYYQ